MDNRREGGKREAAGQSFYGAIYSEVEEVGWENLVQSSEDLSTLIFRITDKEGRAHYVEISLPENYPEEAPSISADVPYNCKLNWTKGLRLNYAIHEFHKHLESLQDFWAIMDGIDRFLWVVHPQHPSRASSYRQIGLGNDVHILLSINPRKPKSFPECRFFGPDLDVNLLRRNWKENRIKWACHKAIQENLMAVLETTMPRNPNMTFKEDNEAECGICYAQYLPVDDELGDSSGGAPDQNCDNPNCGRAFHSVCLRDWLRSITTTRQSFDVLFGNCPYCSEPVAVKVNCNLK